MIDMLSVVCVRHRGEKRWSRGIKRKRNHDTMIYHPKISNHLDVTALRLQPREVCEPQGRLRNRQALTKKKRKEKHNLRESSIFNNAHTI